MDFLAVAVEALAALVQQASHDCAGALATAIRTATARRESATLFVWEGLPSYMSGALWRNAAF